MEPPSRLSRLLRFGLWLVAALFVFFAIDLSLRDSPSMAQVPWIPYSIAQWADQPQNDAIRTAVPFGVLAVLSLLLIAPRAHRAVSLTWLLRAIWMLGWMALAVAVEVSQLWLPHRHSSWIDIQWGWVGVFGGTLAGLGLRGLISLCR